MLTSHALLRWVNCDPHDLLSAAQSCAIRMALDDLHGLLQKSHHNPCTFTSRCVNKCFGNKTFVSIPRGFFAILLSHDDFFYQEALTMMQSEAVVHVPMPDCSARRTRSSWRSSISTASAASWKRRSSTWRSSGRTRSSTTITRCRRS